jgi:hypothetical protein
MPANVLGEGPPERRSRGGTAPKRSFGAVPLDRRVRCLVGKGRHSTERILKELKRWATGMRMRLQ